MARLIIKWADWQGQSRLPPSGQLQFGPPEMWRPGCKVLPEGRRFKDEVGTFILYASFQALRLRAIFFRTTAQVGRVRKDSR